MKGLNRIAPATLIASSDKKADDVLASLSELSGEVGAALSAYLKFVGYRPVNGEDVGEPAVVRLAPDVTVVARVNQRDADREGVAALPDATLAEIYAYGVRNPQRFGWDALRGSYNPTDERAAKFCGRSRNRFWVRPRFTSRFWKNAKS